MFRVSGVGRTARVSEVKEEKRTINGKPVDYKSINFTIATDRNYKDGKGNRIADFIFCVVGGAVGSYQARLVDVISTYASKKNAEGKLVSRLVEVSGRLFAYNREVPVKSEENVNVPLSKALIKKYNISKEETNMAVKLTSNTHVKETQYYVAVEEFNLLDSDKTKTTTTSKDNDVKDGIVAEAIEPENNKANSKAETKTDAKEDITDNKEDDDVSVFNGQDITPLDDGSIPF